MPLRGTPELKRYVQKTTHDELRSSMHTLGDRLGRLKKALNYHLFQLPDALLRLLPEADEVT